MLHIPLHILLRTVRIEFDPLPGAQVIGGGEADVLDVPVIAEGVVHERTVVNTAAGNDAGKALDAVDRRDIPLTAVEGKAEIADSPRIGPQEKVGIREDVAVPLDAPPFGIELQARILGGFAGNNVDDAADGVGSVFGGRRAADDLDALHVFRSQALQLVAGAGILGKIPHDGLAVDENQRMPRLGTANGYAYTAHGIDRPGHAGFIEDNVLDGFRLLGGDVLLRDNRRALGFVLGFFLSRVGGDYDIPRRNVMSPPVDCLPHKRAEPARSGRHNSE